MGRLALTDIRFKNGNVLPKGTPFGIPLWPLAHDPEHWPEPSTFDPWRHVKMGEAEGNRVDNLMTAARYVNTLVAEFVKFFES